MRLLYLIGQSVKQDSQFKLCYYVGQSPLLLVCVPKTLRHDSLPLPVLSTPSPPLILSWSVTSVYSHQDSLTVAVSPTSIQGTPSYRPTPTPGRLLEENTVCLWIVLFTVRKLSNVTGCLISLDKEAQNQG